MHLTTNGKPCVSDNAFWQGMAELSGKNGPDYSTPAGPFAPGSKNITIGGWAGLVSDVRLYDGQVDAATLEKLHSSTEHIYKSTEYQVPSEAEIAQLNRTWRAPELGPAQMTMYNAWLNHNVSASSLAVPSWLSRVVMGSGEHPALETAAGELRAALPVSRHDIAGIWVAFFQRVPAISLRTGADCRPGRADGGGRRRGSGGTGRLDRARELRRALGGACAAASRSHRAQALRAAGGR